MEKSNRMKKRKMNVDPQYIAGKGEEVLITNGEENFERFEDMGLKEGLLRGINSQGFNKPSPIQQKGILHMIQGKDIIAQAQSGTGKTGCFAIPIL